MENAISAIVVGRNEAKKLTTCLKSLSFCNEIIYADLDSSDDSVQIAKRFGCKVFKYKDFGPSCEYTIAEVIKYVNNDWVITVDPDEEVSMELIQTINKRFTSWSKNDGLAEIKLPWKFFVGQQSLKGTVWGNKQHKGVLFNKNRYACLPITHYGRYPLTGYDTVTLDYENDGCLNHYWMDNLKGFVDKHLRYLKDEGRDRYNLGKRTSLVRAVLITFPIEFYRCYIKSRGYKDSITGFWLSMFWALYSFSAESSLYYYQLKGYFKGGKGDGKSA